MNRNKSLQRLSAFTMILVSAMLACQSVSDFRLFATPTPTATATFTPSPTPTFTSTPSATPTFTPSPTPVPTGRAKRTQPDGGILFIDYDGGYQVTFPKGWTVVILDKDDISEALANMPEQEESLSELLDNVQSMDLNNMLRVCGYNFGAQQGPYTPNINIAYDKSSLSAAMSLQALVNATASYYPSLKVKVTSSGLDKTASGLEIGVIETEWSMKDAGGKKINLRQKQVLFKAGEGTVVITFSTVKNATVDLDSDFKKLIDSVELFD